ncbi:MAG: DUF5671 domain-containing protein [Anaerolineales bacterium]|nr:DUF5671 domain-containing protein [Anaerolineales bacterium]MCX7608467.1 DUF5671 domain-containing protein [Anaerolineales bacterium]MDW8227593.1 DUF5671 domain-containing protein [Anaerolineales bacterium]
MRTIRRLYFYAVAFVSLEVTLWGLISLGRTMVCRPGLVVCGDGASLARALSLILVGLPLFLFHWWFAQRLALRDGEERSSWVRALFLYSVLLATLIPVVQNLLALSNRFLLSAFGLTPLRALVGGEQSWSDNLIAIGMNALIAAYFLSVLRADWTVVQPIQEFANVRRLYRYVWVIYGLGLLTTGLYFLVRFVFVIDVEWVILGTFRYWGVNGMVSTAFGALLWAYSWVVVQRSLIEQEERESYVRLGLLYLLSLGGAVITVIAGSMLLRDLLWLLFGRKTDFTQFVSGLGSPMSMLVPALLVWAYYGSWLSHTLKEVPEAPRRAGMNRLYFYLLSAIGLTIWFAGLTILARLILDLLFFSSILLPELASSRLVQALTYLLTGLPLWLVAWRKMQTEALSPGDAGDHARRSVIRKGYLYLAIFVSVVVSMILAIASLTNLLNVVFSVPTGDWQRNVLTLLVLLLLFVGLGVYHGLSLGWDAQLSARALGEKYAAFPVLIFDTQDGFGQQMSLVLQKVAPTLPVRVQPAEVPPDASFAPQAVIVPSALAFNLPDRLRTWLATFSGRKLVIPYGASDWQVVGQMAQIPYRQAAQIIQQWAEGQEHRPVLPTWQIILYVLLALWVLPVLFSLLGLFVSTFLD